ncbi:hypothetical protein MBLNU230_g2408t1 [Neophaeotheca triangularis]
MANPRVTPPTFEHHHSGLGIGVSRPRISWRFLAGEETASAWEQTSYEVEIALQGSQPTTYSVDGSQSIVVPWPGEALRSRQSAVVRVRSFGISANSSNPTPTDWSKPSTVEAALLHDEDWGAQFITSTSRVRHPDGPFQPLRFRKTFELPQDRKIARARLYVTALGIFDVYVDGRATSDELLAPGWTSYSHRLTYRTLDVTNSLEKDGTTHVVCAELAEGWYAGRLGFLGGKRDIYGEDLAIMAQLEVTFDGEDQQPWRLISDESWQWTKSAIQRSEFYDGEVYDASNEFDWLGPSIEHQPEASWTAAKALPPIAARLATLDAPPVRVTEKLPPVEIFQSKSGRTVVDFGQNLVGKVEVHLPELPRGSQITLRHAEVMENGELGVRPLREARSEDIYISSGKGPVTWTPTFAFHGFRFVQVDGWKVAKSDIEALVMHSDMPRRGEFSCSNSWVNKLHENVVWSMRGNFVSIPTDCPQRDERLGWTGDIQAFTPSASFLYDTSSFLGSWLEDVMDEQLESGKGGIPPLVVPGAALPPNWPHMPQAVWDDVTVLTPMDLFRANGDKAVLERQLPSMKAWLDQGIDRGDDGLWNPDRWQLSDWLDPGAPPMDPGYSRTDNVMVADAYLVHVTRTMSEVCSVLGHAELAKQYSGDADRLRSLFQHKYITPAGHLMSNTQTGLALAIQFGLYTDQKSLSVAGQDLRKQVRAAKFHISTGFAGTPVVTHALTTTAQSQLAYRMLLEKTCPSWLYPVSMGATTVWERWDSMLEDGSINPGKMTSFNHYAFGSVANWLHKTVGGISPAEPGWRKICVRPVPGGNITSARVSFDGPFGMIDCSWSLKKDRAEREPQKFEMSLVVPPNSSAEVTLPGDLEQSIQGKTKKSVVVKSGRHVFSCDYDAGEWPPSAIYAANQKVPKPDIAE